MVERSVGDVATGPQAVTKTARIVTLRKIWSFIVKSPFSGQITIQHIKMFPTNQEK